MSENENTATDPDLVIASLDIDTRSAMYHISQSAGRHNADAKRLEEEAAEARSLRNQELRTLRNSGLSVRQIADSVGMGVDNVKAIVR